MKLKSLIQLYKNMGSRYFGYRLKHEVEKRMGILKNRHPNNLDYGINNTKEEINSTLKNFEFDLNKLSRNENLNELKSKVEKILAGNIPFFNAEWIDLGKKYDWISNPISNYTYDIKKHWSEIPDFSEEAGDIKYVWEKSRFSWLTTLIRYDYHFQVDLSEFVFSEIDSWIDHNPINMGPNWRCSQEISLRIFNWYFALIYYRDNVNFTEERWTRIQKVIYASLHHVFNHIDFSRIAVRNNHAITETLFLALSELLFPFIPETKLHIRYTTTDRICNFQ